MSQNTLKLMWREEHVGNVVPTRSDMPDNYGDLVLVTQNSEIIAFLRSWGEHDVLSTEVPQVQFREEFIDAMFNDWTLVDPDGTSAMISTYPSVDIGEGVICWREKLQA